MLYRLQIYGLVAALILAGAGLVILSLFILFQTKVWWPLNKAPETGLECVHITSIPQLKSRQSDSPRTTLRRILFPILTLHLCPSSAPLCGETGSPDACNHIKQATSDRRLKPLDEVNRVAPTYLHGHQHKARISLKTIGRSAL